MLNNASCIIFLKNEQVQKRENILQNIDKIRKLINLMCDF